MTVIPFPSALRTPAITEADKAQIARIADCHPSLFWKSDREGPDEWITLVLDGDEAWCYRSWLFLPQPGGWVLLGTDWQEMARGKTLAEVLTGFSLVS